MKEIFWVNDDRASHLAIIMRPHGDDWLEDEFRRLKLNGVETVVSLLEPFEANSLGLSKEEDAAFNAGLVFLNYPIPDRQVPHDLAGFSVFVQGIAERLARGEHIGVHCRGCIGRATITTACTLIHLGWNPSAALAAIENMRGVPVPDTPEQADWILQYKGRS